MDKKEVFDYLAKTYLSSYSKDTRTRAKSTKKRSYRPAILLACFFILVIGSTFLYSSFSPTAGITFKESALSILPADEPITFKYDFSGSDVKRSSYSLSFNPTDVKDFSFLLLSMKQSEPKGSLNIRIDIENKRNEKDTLYLQNINSQWQKFSIPLERFKHITDFSDIVLLAFGVEEWNAEHKAGTLFIDNVAFSKH